MTGKPEVSISIDDFRWDEKAGLRRDALSSQVIDALAAQEIRRPAMKKPSTMTRGRNGQLTIWARCGRSLELLLCSQRNG
jgi:hypothetical protein